MSKNFNITERVKARFSVDFFNFFNHPNYGSLGDNQGLVSIGFNATNCVVGLQFPKCQADSPEFLDASGNSIIPTPTNSGLANAVRVQNSTPSAAVAQVSTQSDRNREIQYSLRFTF